MSEKLPFYHSLRFKLSCLFICFVAVPIILFLVIFIKEVQDSSGEKYRSMLNSSLSQTAQNVSADLDMVIRSAKIFVNDPEIANTLQMDSSDKYNIYQKKLQLKERLENIKTQYSFVTRAVLIHGNKSMVDIADLLIYDGRISCPGGGQSGFLASKAQEQGGSLQKLDSSSYLGIFQPANTYLPRNIDCNLAAYQKNGRVNTLYFPIYDEDYENYLAVLEINMDISQLLEPLKAMALTEEIYWGIFSEDFQNCFYHNGGDFWEQLSPSAFQESKTRVGSERYSVLTQKIELMNVWIACLTPTKLPSGKMASERVMLAVILGVLIIFTAAIFLYSNHVVRDILRLDRSMRTIHSDLVEQKLPAPIHTDSKSEVGTLVAGYNAMLEKIRSLMDDIKTAYEQENKAIFQNLEHQLRAHFLFNALDMVRMTAREQKQGQIEKAVNIIMQYLKFTLRNTGKICTVSEELKNISRFIEMHNLIRQTPIGYCLKTSGKINGNAGSYSMLNFILQPLVENSIRHGFAKKDTGCELTIEIYADDRYLTLTVEDNGMGFDTSKDIKEISSGFGIGLVNIQERLQRLFPGNHEFEITSFPEIGTCVRIKMPLIQSDAEPMP